MKHLIILLLTLVAYTPTFSAPKSTLDKFWDKADNSNTARISHVAFDKFLGTYVSQVNSVKLVRYNAVTPQDKALLDSYIKTLENTPIFTYSKAEQQAYWINLYNALTVQVILDNYPVKSIKEAYGGVFKSGPWDKKLLTIEGKKVSLNDIEHTILRPIWKDSRVHFLVNCASIGCPDLLLKAITPDTYEAVADKSARDFINSARALSLEKDTLVLSSLFDWYGVDFGANTKEIIAYITKYANAQSKAKLNNYKTISYTYDWNLNEVR